MNKDFYFMRRCFELARKGAGRTSPNPMVGAVIVKNGKVLSEGFHRKAGLSHAEINALQKLNFKAPGATLYCNLEPCFHFGQTPPCVLPLIQSGISRVVIAHSDPNPLVSGKSIKLLKKNGIKVTEGVLEKEANELNRFFLTWMIKNRPYVILKAAVSLNGKISRPKGSKWITGLRARQRVHEIRSQVDGILVGVNTVLSDDPQLNVRGIKRGALPVRVILDSYLRTPYGSKIFSTPGGKVILATTSWHSNRIKKYQDLGAFILNVKADSKGEVSLSDLLYRLARLKIISLLVEGGAIVLKAFEEKKLFDEINLFVAPRFINDSEKSWIPSMPLKFLSLDCHGPDFELCFVRS